ncbi:hypothetical protein IX84_00385 [Phaeodactylibacter xiamenensis]|uniref:Uncharacterized protein n=1 Tax=Phaeodactylibacter xiamenensis TaxID=1524460 RepID=A0A098SG71_9BACT|nr:hypothetical protein IX84_00385 [Phaeodactylibacter xiamenensis]
MQTALRGNNQTIGYLDNSKKPILTALLTLEAMILSDYYHIELIASTLEGYQFQGESVQRCY